MAVSSAASPKGQLPSSFDIKSSHLPLVSLVIRSNNLNEVATDLVKKFGPAGESSDFFDHDPLVLDFSQFTPVSSTISLVSLLDAVRTSKLKAVAIRTSDDHLLQLGAEHGLVQALIETQRKGQIEKKLAEEASVARPPSSSSTLVIDKPLRSGQKIYARGGDLVVLAMVNAGAEVAADGNIHVYAPLRGKAMAGANGNTQARIFSLCMEPELISIAGVYRTSENPLPPQVIGRAAQVRLSNDGQDKLLIEALKA